MMNFNALKKTLFILCTITATNSMTQETNTCSFALPSVDDAPWDAFWAQHYIGADLLRHDLKKSTVTTADISRLVGVWDTEYQHHGEFVSELIAGPRPSAPIPFDGHINYIDLLAGYNQSLKDPHYIDLFLKLFRNCYRQNNCPLYINSSMRWSLRPVDNLTHFVSLASTRGITFITSADNSNRLVSAGKRNLALDDRIIIVSSLSPNGDPSTFTSYGDLSTISAPSDTFIRSYTFAGQSELFGGTSGATPLVTGTIGAFTLISDYPLEAKEIKHLLTQTAIPLPRLPKSNLLGAGMVNSYKIGRVAQRLQDRCNSDLSEREQYDCMSDLLRTEEIYNFKTQSQSLIDSAQGAFPLCFPEVHTMEEATNCQQTKSFKAFNDIRRAAFLYPENPQIWQKIVCINKNYIKSPNLVLFTGHEEQHTRPTYVDITSMKIDFYKSLAEPLDDEKLVESICKSKLERDHRLAQYFPENLVMNIVNRVNNTKCHPHVLDHAIMALHQSWTSNPKDLLNNLFNRENNRHNITMIANFFRANLHNITPSQRVEFVDKIMRHNNTSHSAIKEIFTMLVYNPDSFSDERKEALMNATLGRNDVDSILLRIVVSFLNESFKTISKPKALITLHRILEHHHANEMILNAILNLMINHNKEFSASEISKVVNHFFINEKMTESMLSSITRLLSQTFPLFPRTQIEGFVEKVLGHDKVSNFTLASTISLLNKHFNTFSETWRSKTINDIFTSTKIAGFTFTNFIKLLSNWFDFIPSDQIEQYFDEILKHEAAISNNFKEIVKTLNTKFDQFPPDKREEFIDTVISHKKTQSDVFIEMIKYIDTHFAAISETRQGEIFNKILDHKKVTNLVFNNILHFIAKNTDYISHLKKDEYPQALITRILRHEKIRPNNLMTLIDFMKKNEDKISAGYIYELSREILQKENIDSRTLHALNTFIEDKMANFQDILNLIKQKKEE